MKNTISIVGLGWLGFPLALHFYGLDYKVKGTVTSKLKLEELTDIPIQTSMLKVTNKQLRWSDKSFFDSETVIINFPPIRVEGIEEIYPQQVKKLIAPMVKSGVKNVLFVSSTSVYPEVNAVVDESFNILPTKASGLACLRAEQMLQNETSFKTTVVRFGGLIGADRNPARFLAKATNVGAGDKPVNLIHFTDCIRIISKIVKEQAWDEVYNAVSPIHPTRNEFYNYAAALSGVPKINFEINNDFKYKIVNSNKLQHQLNYGYRFPSPMDYLDEFFKKRKNS